MIDTGKRCFVPAIFQLDTDGRMNREYFKGKRHVEPAKKGWHGRVKFRSMQSKKLRAERMPKQGLSFI
jgi:hypothetical protein